jgi:integrase
MERQLEQAVPGRIGAYARVYLDTLEAEARALGTRYEVWRELCRLGEEFPDAEPGDFTTMDLERFLAVRCRDEHGLLLSPATRKKVLAIVSGFFGYLHDRSVVDRNPTRPIRRPQLPEPEPTYWDADEIRAILATEMQPRDHLLLETLARTGQRSGVVRTLRWSDVRLDGKNPEINFRRGKGGKVFSVPLDRELLHDFIVYRRLANPAPDSWVFQSRTSPGDRSWRSGQARPTTW